MCILSALSLFPNHWKHPYFIAFATALLLQASFHIKILPQILPPRHAYMIDPNIYQVSFSLAILMISPPSRFFPEEHSKKNFYKIQNLPKFNIMWM